MGACEGWNLSASQLMTGVLMVIHSTEWKHALSYVPDCKWLQFFGTGWIGRASAMTSL